MSPKSLSSLGCILPWRHWGWERVQSRLLSGSAEKWLGWYWKRVSEFQKGFWWAFSSSHIFRILYLCAFSGMEVFLLSCFAISENSLGNSMRRKPKHQRQPPSPLLRNARVPFIPAFHLWDFTRPSQRQLLERQYVMTHPGGWSKYHGFNSEQRNVGHSFSSTHILSGVHGEWKGSWTWEGLALCFGYRKMKWRPFPRRCPVRDGKQWHAASLSELWWWKCDLSWGQTQNLEQWVWAEVSDSRLRIDVCASDLDPYRLLHLLADLTFCRILCGFSAEPQTCGEPSGDLCLPVRSSSRRKTSPSPHLLSPGLAVDMKPLWALYG